MNRISSRWTFFYKRLFIPCILAIFASVFASLCIGGLSAEDAKQLALMALITIVVAATPMAIVWRIVSRLVDEVWDCGQELLVRNDAKEFRIPLREIQSVDYSWLVQPQRVTLKLASDSVANDTITFMPPIRAFALSAPPIVREFRVRIERLHRV